MKAYTTHALVAHLQFAQTDTQSKNCKRATKPTHHDRHKMYNRMICDEEGRTANIALAIWRGDEYILNFLFANQLRLQPTNKAEQ